MSLKPPLLAADNDAIPSAAFPFDTSRSAQSSPQKMDS